MYMCIYRICNVMYVIRISQKDQRRPLRSNDPSPRARQMDPAKEEIPGDVFLKVYQRVAMTYV